MSPKQPSPRRVKKSDIGVIIILVLVLVGIAMLVNRTLNKADELTQQDFYQILEDERFQEIVIQPAGGSEGDPDLSVHDRVLAGCRKDRQLRHRLCGLRRADALLLPLQETAVLCHRARCGCRHLGGVPLRSGRAVLIGGERHA